MRRTKFSLYKFWKSFVFSAELKAHFYLESKKIIFLPNTSEAKFQVQNFIFSRISPCPNQQILLNYWHNWLGSPYRDLNLQPLSQQHSMNKNCKVKSGILLWCSVFGLDFELVRFYFFLSALDYWVVKILLYKSTLRYL